MTFQHTVCSNIFPTGIFSGAIRPRYDDFRSIRDARIDRTVVETNKIIIRLGKVTDSSYNTGTSKKIFMTYIRMNLITRNHSSLRRFSLILTPLAFKIPLKAMLL